MTSHFSPTDGASPQKPTAAAIVLRTPKEEAKFLKVSISWLAKARMRGDGPPYLKVGRSIRYTETGSIQWMKSRQRQSTSGNYHLDSARYLHHIEDAGECGELWPSGLSD